VGFAEGEKGLWNGKKIFLQQTFMKGKKERKNRSIDRFSNKP
jgi:hypothetical protein